MWGSLKNKEKKMIFEKMNKVKSERMKSNKAILKKNKEVTLYFYHWFHFLTLIRNKLISRLRNWLKNLIYGKNRNICFFKRYKVKFDIKKQ